MTTERRKYSWVPIAIQTLVLLGAIIGFALANEHRITVLETCMASTTQNLKDALVAVQELQKNQVKILVILDSIERRHQREDAQEKNK